MTEAEVLELYRRTGAMKQGHFRLSSGLHSDRYFQSALVLAHPELAERLGRALGGRFAATDVDVVLGPALGAVVVAHEVGRALGKRALFAERADEGFALRRGFALEPGERVLIVEDVLTTGRSIGEIEPLVTGSGAVVAGYGCLVNRMPAGVERPVQYLARVEATTWKPQECPQCRSGSPVEVPGSRKQA